jgi:hypothetical protein
MPPKAAQVSEYERKRLETIAKNKALLRNLAIDAAASGLAPAKVPKKPVASAAAAKRATRKSAAPIKVKEEDLGPRRVSARLRGIVPDSEVAKRKYEDHVERLRQEDQAKRQRVSGDLKVEDILTNGQAWDSNGNFLRGVGVGPARPYESTFDLEGSKKASDKEVKDLIEKLNDLSVWQGIEPAHIKITPERVVSNLYPQFQVTRQPKYLLTLFCSTLLRFTRPRKRRLYLLEIRQEVLEFSIRPRKLEMSTTNGHPRSRR